MKLFAVGPVEMYPETMEIGGKQVPYFRNEEFSQVVLHTMDMLKESVNAPEGSEAIMLACSGTGAMEAAVMNCFSESDKVLVIDGGSFGHRFVELCQIHNIPYTPLAVDRGETLTRNMLEQATGEEKFTGLLVNIHETSTGQLYDKQMLSDFCKERELFFAVDAISSYLADELDMCRYGIDLVIASSQKALALAPGLSMIVASPNALQRAENSTQKTMYFDFRSYISNGKRGQTPFTPSIRVMYELEDRLTRIYEKGVDKVISETAEIAEDFRKKIREIGLSFPDYPLSNFETPVIFPENSADAYEVFLQLEKEYGFVVNPNGGDLASVQFRVGHIGNHSIEDNDMLVDAIRQIMDK
ncbi:MAG: aminotransferase class V-fold PLP-dependent enzyme [Bacillota bacterium]|nr:aminotransferase class V-fold PLP-dependent enzyme [Bacillota bacterium]